MASVFPTAWTVFNDSEDAVVVDIDEGHIHIVQDEDVVRLNLDDIGPLCAALKAAEKSFREQIA
jgi:hypothetical protein